MLSEKYLSIQYFPSTFNNFERFDKSQKDAVVDERLVYKRLSPLANDAKDNLVMEGSIQISIIADQQGIL
uniref:Uncharacterized protein n=1 Tax=Onchocerca volvulus TaxID=6282 RepID=A0A8R1Y3E1_ONCVO